MTQTDACVTMEVLHQIVVMRREQRATTQIGQVVDDRRSDGRSVVGGRSAPQFVQQHQTIDSGVLQNSGRFAELNEERAVTGHDVVLGTQSREDAIDDGHATARRRNRATLRKSMCYWE